MASLKVGRVTHYFDKIKVAVIELTSALGIGETVEFEKAGFSQTVQSMQQEHEQVNSAKKSETVGLLVEKPVKSGDTVLKKS